MKTAICALMLKTLSINTQVAKKRGVKTEIVELF